LMFGNFDDGGRGSVHVLPSGLIVTPPQTVTSSAESIAIMVPLLCCSVIAANPAGASDVPCRDPCDLHALAISGATGALPSVGDRRPRVVVCDQGSETINVARGGDVDETTGEGAHQPRQLPQRVLQSR